MQHGDDDRDEQKRDPAFLPTPEEIAMACDEIRAGWSEEQAISRRHFQIPKIKAFGVVEQAKQARAAMLFRERERQRRAATAG